VPERFRLSRNLRAQLASARHHMHYNFARVHQSLVVTNGDGSRTQRTPAMAAGVTDHVWTLTEIAGLIDSN
jgi:hypothetical protein